MRTFMPLASSSRLRLSSGVRLRFIGANSDTLSTARPFSPSSTSAKYVCGPLLRRPSISPRTHTPSEKPRRIWSLIASASSPTEYVGFDGSSYGSSPKSKAGWLTCRISLPDGCDTPAKLAG